MEPKVHIAYVLDSFPVLSETFIRQEILALHRQGKVNVHIFAFNRHTANLNKSEQALVDNTVYLNEVHRKISVHAIYKTGLFSREALSFILNQRHLPRRSLWYQSMKLAMLIRRRAPLCTHIHAHFGWGSAAHAITAARMLGLGASFTCHGSDVFARPQDLHLKLAAADRVIGVCDGLVDHLQQHTPTPVYLVPCGVDTTAFRPLDTHQQGRKNNKLLFVGRLIDCKGLDDVFHALALVPPANRLSIDIVGDGPLGPALKALARTLALEPWVSFLGSKTATWLQQHGPYYRGFIGAFRQGSDGARDTGPVVIKEAMAMGLPVIATHFMGLNQILDATCSLQVAPGNRQELSQALFQFWEKEPSELLRMGKNARHLVCAKYVIDQQVQTLTEILSVGTNTAIS